MPRVIATGDSVIDDEMKAESAAGSGMTSAKEAALTLRDPKTGALLQQSAEYAGCPLAASNGSILIASGPVLRCLR